MFQAAVGSPSRHADAGPPPLDTTVPLRREPPAGKPDYSTLFQSARPIGADGSCRAVAYGATLAQLCLGAGPLVLALHLGHDADAAYWIGGVGRWALAAPAFSVALHFLHLQLIRTGQQGMLILLAMCLPALALACVGVWYAAGAHFAQGHLLAEGCGSPSASRLQRCYEGAQLLWLACLRRLLAENGGAPPLRRPPLPACQEWAAANDEIPEGDLADLRYLATAEAAHSCGGFCHAGPALFSAPDEISRQGGGCAGPVAEKLQSVARRGGLLVGAALAELAALAVLLLSANPLLMRLGYKRGGGASAGSETSC